MAKTKAYTKIVGPIGSNNQDESNLIHQSSPAWVLTFIRWNVRDTLRAISQSGGDTQTLLQVRDPLVVENDCVQLSVNVNKSTLTHSVNATLVETDVNYATAIAPGDFLFVNILNWESDARKIVDIARSKKLGSINGINDGFKGLFKVQGVRKTVTTDPQTGTKRVVIRVNGFAFTEFNNSIYFNPYLLNTNAGSDKDKLLFAANLSSDYAQLNNANLNATCQDMIKFLIQAFIGIGISDKGTTNVSGVPVTSNTHFYIPSQVGILLGVQQAKAAKDIYNYLFGIQQYEASSKSTALQIGMNPSTQAPNDRFYYTTYGKCDGQTLLKAEYWNQEKAWSIIGQYTNSPLNELYTCFRISPEGRVMPTVVYRQTPFTSELFGKDPFQSSAKVTRFLNLPRWKISSALIIGSDLGRDEAARINYVQIYAQPPSNMGKPDANISAQTAAKNFAYDVNDVLRSGLRPSVITTTFQDLTAFNDANIGRKWSLIVGDAVIGGHLKLNGTLECVGIVDPIAVGDNLEYDGSVYHIEEVVHTCGIAAQSGIKSFRTILKLSSGVSIADNKSGLAYPEMTYPGGYEDRNNNFTYGDQSLPGISEEQDVSDRPNTAPSENDIKKKGKPFAQPGQIIKPIKDSDE